VVYGLLHCVDHALQVGDAFAQLGLIALQGAHHIESRVPHDLPDLIQWQIQRAVEQDLL
jgi:hypothetical protein